MSSEDPLEMKLKSERYDSLINARQVIPTKYLSAEPNLMVTKWPAYRFMSPWEATALFAKEYEAAYRACVRNNLDRDQATRVRPISKLGNKAQNAHFTQMWVARQHADEIGVQYAAYLEFCFDFAMRRVRKKLPMPNQLRPNEKTAVAWAAEFVKFWTDARRLLVEDREMPLAQYADQNSRELPAQMGFKGQLHLDMRRLGCAFAAGRLVQWQQMSREECEESIPAEQLSLAIKDIEDDLKIGIGSRIEYDPLPGPAFFQSCFGMIDLVDTGDTPCKSCPQAATCAKMGEIVTKGLKNLTGSADPIGDERRRKQREDTARSRAKSKAALVASSAQSTPLP